MIDLSEKMEVFMTTNGRSTFDYSYNSVMEQEKVQFKTTVLENMEWIDANKKMVKDCGSRFYVRVDDDMFLHPLAIFFIWNSCRKNKDNIALKGWRLWEPYSNKVCKGIKCYNVDATRKVGLRISKLGKIDKMFTEDARKKGYKILWYQDVLGIHGCSTYDEHLEYALKLHEDKGKNFDSLKKWMKNSINSCKLSTREQSDMRHDFLEKVNKKRKTCFINFTKKAKKHE